jgi:hypothetical protein
VEKGTVEKGTSYISDPNVSVALAVVSFHLLHGASACSGGSGGEKKDIKDIRSEPAASDVTMNVKLRLRDDGR